VTAGGDQGLQQLAKRALADIKRGEANTEAVQGIKEVVCGVIDSIARYYSRQLPADAKDVYQGIWDKAWEIYWGHDARGICPPLERWLANPTGALGGFLRPAVNNLASSRCA